ncbi:MAG: hypothetical protein R8N23_04530 [Reichenbachiella sp.]|uniref:hypothetical protein n=1 Tax=Reichenbachiella sp. TaxID=2184521 RepID=UPI002966EF17|nr:hypothetical protein [Reichenbachiella sp.]MDW3209108.1 hypothetical protein [Reichenbachiella sp.]
MKKPRKLLFGKTLLLAFAGTILVIVLLVFLTGLSSHRTIIDNSIISLLILSICFFSFLTIGLYNGLNVYDNLSHKLQLTWKKSKDGTSNTFIDTPAIDAPDMGDGCEGVILGIILWIVLSIAFVILMFVLSTVVWATAVLLTLAIYWLMIRALKLVFNKSEECMNDLPRSITYAFGYTVFFVSWLFGIIYISTLF